MDEGNIIRMLEMLGSHRIKRSGDNIITSCPLGSHVDRNPSFTINVNSNGPSRWQCFSCGEKANKTISLLYKLQENGGGWRSDIHDMIKSCEYGSPIARIGKLKSWGEQRAVASQRLSSRLMAQGSGYSVRDYEGTFNLDDFKEAMTEVPPYILERGISVQTCVRWQLGFLKNDFPPRLFIPVFANDRRFVGYSGRLIEEPPDWLEHQPPKYKHAQYFTKEKYLYGEHLIDLNQRTCFIMESFMDVLNLDQMGVKNCLAIMGSSISAAQVDKIKTWFERVVIFPHDDKPNKKGVCPGMHMAETAKNALDLAGLKVIIGPIVPHERQIGNEIRSPQDPGEWNIADLRWAFDIVRRISLGQSEARSEAEKES